MKKIIKSILIALLIVVIVVILYLMVAPKLNAEHRAIDRWITTNNLNEYGDLQGTVYSGGTPLFNEATGEQISKYDYIIKMHPDKPWEK